METRNINITPGGTTPTIHVSQNDVGRTIIFNISDGTGWYDLTGCSVVLAGTKPSGLGFTINGVVDEHTVTITTEKLMTSEYGNIACELKITKGTDKIGTSNIILAVEKDPHPDHITDGNVDDLIPEITVLVERIEAAVEKAEVLFESEAWARGTRDGEPVDEEDPTYHNNSKYYKEQAANSERSAATSEQTASQKAAQAATSASDADAAKTNAEAAQAAAEAAAEAAASVYATVGTVTFSVLETGQVRETWLLED